MDRHPPAVSRSHARRHASIPIPFAPLAPTVGRPRRPMPNDSMRAPVPAADPPAGFRGASRPVIRTVCSAQHRALHFPMHCQRAGFNMTAQAGAVVIGLVIPSPQRLYSPGIDCGENFICPTYLAARGYRHSIAPVKCVCTPEPKRTSSAGDPTMAHSRTRESGTNARTGTETSWPSPVVAHSVLRPSHGTP